MMDKRKILIVDDDPNVRESLHIRLKANDFDVFLAEDGVGSIAETLVHEPDLILLDIGIPAGNGFTVLRRLRENTRLSSIPVIVISGRDQEPNRRLALQAGAKAFLQKPVKNAQLLSAIRQTLDQQPRDAVTVYELGC